MPQVVQENYVGKIYIDFEEMKKRFVEVKKTFNAENAKKFFNKNYDNNSHKSNNSNKSSQSRKSSKSSQTDQVTYFFTH